MTDFGNILKQAQQMQEQMQKAQQELANRETTGESGAGLVKVTMNGRYEVRSIEIDDSLMDEDREMLEDLVAAAINDTVKKIAENSKEQLSGLAGGLNLPKDFKIPF